MTKKTFSINGLLGKCRISALLPSWHRSCPIEFWVELMNLYHDDKKNQK
jgi:hypothetical protein